ncbi:MAG: aminoglycoside phosphotransferase [Deltaproteobacteria bacterium]|nr:MAG: aminoglycoside phosphotransferase [Deltaproteobacteria bacterium]
MLQDIIKPYLSLITDEGVPPDPVRITGDGSNRPFYRISGSKGSLIVVLPESKDPLHLKEGEAYHYIGRHLAAKGIPTPVIYGYDRATGAIIMEDLGDRHLERAVREENNTGATERWYLEAVDILVNMQVRGAGGFDTRYCFDTPVYDRRLMLERESGYFVQAFLQGYLGLKITWDELSPDFERLADLAGEQPPTLFLHRDFQSRNLMVCKGRLRLIDFQGGRLGPPAYDLASLLFDPYVDLPDDMKEALFETYLRRMKIQQQINEEDFRHHFWYIALQRALQVLGAFGFLTRVKKKAFFEPYIPVAVKNLKNILDREIFVSFQKLRQVVSHI